MQRSVSRQLASALESIEAQVPGPGGAPRPPCLFLIGLRLPDRADERSRNPVEVLRNRLGLPLFEVKLDARDLQEEVAPLAG